MIYRFNKIDNQNVILLLFAFIVGLIVGLFAAVFRLLINYIDGIRTYLFFNADTGSLSSWAWPILFSIVGVVVALYFVKRFAPETAGSGVQEIEGALDGIRPVRWQRVIPVKFFAGLFSLGSGLLLGREGPTIQLGGNIGKMVKDVFRQSDVENNPLVSAGAAAGLAGAFNAPFSGIIFVIEEMHGHFKFNFYSLAAIMIGSGTADFVVRAMIGSRAVIEMTVFSHLNIYYLWLFIVLGLVFSVIGLIYNKLIIISLNFFSRMEKVPIIITAVFVGLIIALVGIFYPDMIGSGYHTISKAISNSFGLSFLLVLFLTRLFLSVFSYGVGVPGGLFAPMLTLGVILGMLYGNLMQEIFPEVIVYPGVFAVAGMAAIFASTVRAPLTGLVLAIEMTSNFELILPLIITTVTASTITALMGNKPIYTTLLKRTLAKEKELS